MDSLILPKGYASALSPRETQKATEQTRDLFQQHFSKALNLERITCPLFVTKESGINDDLNGVERKVEFSMKNIDGTAQVVQSLAKWKRVALKRYGYKPGEGIYTNMSAIRRDDDCDSLHSLYVDQWDWEKVITRADRNTEFLKETVRKIAGALADTKDDINAAYPGLKQTMERNVTFLTTQELEDSYPELSPKERENVIVKKYGTVFLMQIGDLLKSGQKHDGRAPDYDDWTLNGDLLVWNNILDCAEELSSMGIRVDETSLGTQLKKCSAEERLQFPYHKAIANGTLPLSIGGGIGQSRVCLFMLEKAHIGEVQVSVWPDEMFDICHKHGIELLK